MPNAKYDPIELRATVAAGNGDHDLSITARNDATVADVARDLSTYLGERDGLALWSERHGAYVPGALTLGDCDLRWGDRLKLLPQDRELTRFGGDPVAELAVTSGPDAGKKWELGLGSYPIGRDAPTGITIQDPSLSRSHGRLDVTSTSVTYTDLDSSNGSALSGTRLSPNTAVSLSAGAELQLGRSLVRVSSSSGSRLSAPRVSGALVQFNRGPRVRRRPEIYARTLAAPPDEARKLKVPLASAVVPLIGGVVMFVVLHAVYMLAISALSPIMAFTSFVGDRRGGIKAFGHGSRSFQQNLEQAVAELDDALAVETERRRSASPPLDVLKQRAIDVDPSLWERRPEDPDFMTLRIGVADQPAESRVVIADGGSEALRDRAEQELAARATAGAVPLTVPMLEAGVLGLTGSRRLTTATAASLALQAASLHSPADVVIGAAISSALASEYGWLKWLPHIDPGRLELEYLTAVGPDQAADLLTAVKTLVARRRADNPLGTIPTPALLLLLDEDVLTNRSLVSAAMQDARAAGVATVWIGHDTTTLPGQTEVLVEAPDERAVATVTHASSGEVVENVSLDGLSSVAATEFARALAPVRDVSEVARAGSIPNRVGLLPLLGLWPLTEAAITAKWERWSGRLDATLGQTVDGAFTVDLRADGPHALIAGTTGSGKSELLRTFVASAAAAAPPDKLTFLLVDYKGGSAFAPCRALPHVVDVVSDLDDHVAERALIALDAELKRREQVLAEYGARDLAELQRRTPDNAPPLLVIAVDEFAKLREEVPEFVDGVVDIAQRGRSLGVHMVLAAQTLRNAFTPAIRANTNLRIALRVADESESDDVISSPVAGRIPSGDRYRGRAFARTGHSELHEFQSAYVSGRSSGQHKVGIEIAELTLGGPVGAEARPTALAESDSESDLTSLGEVATSVQRALRIADPTPPWLPALPSVLDLSVLDQPSTVGSAVIGLIDRPSTQAQDPLIVELRTCGHVAIYGASGSGKTTTMTTLALALAQHATVDELRIYGLVAGSGGLTALEHLPHCGGVVKMDDEERVSRLIRGLVALVEAPTAGGANRTTVLFLDDIDSFATTHDRPGTGTPFQNLHRLLAGGRSAGVHVVMTAARRASIQGSSSTHIGQRLVLRMNATDDMLALGLESKRIKGAKLPAGRGFTQHSEEFQIAVPGHGGKPLAMADAVQHLAASTDPGNRRSVTKISVLPSDVSLSSLGAARAPGAIPLGISDNDFRTASVNLEEGHFLVVGPYRSGRSTALATLVSGLQSAEPEADMFLLAPRRTLLSALGVWKASAHGADECGQALDGLVKRLQDRNGADAPRAFVIIDDAGELSDAASSIKLERLTKAGRDQGLTVIAAAEPGAARGIAVPWLREVRKDGQGLLLQPDLMNDGDLLATRLPRHLATPLTPGRGFLVRRGAAELVHVAR